MKIIKLCRKILRELFLRWRCKPRYDLERKIFPKIKNKRVLFVGVASYTADYIKKLRGNDVWTIDVDPKVAQYGSKKHVIGSISQADEFFEKEFFDIVIICGVFGYGLNEHKEGERVFNAVYKILKKNGILLLGIENKYAGKIPERISNSKQFKRTSFCGFESGYISASYKSGFYFFEFLEKI